MKAIVINTAAGECFSSCFYMCMCNTCTCVVQHYMYMYILCLFVYLVHEVD